MSQPAEIERIVREVLARLAPAASAVAAPAPIGALALAAAVVTKRDLEDRLEGVNSVSVGPRAVVTPAARDYLRERGVSLLRGGAVGTALMGPVNLVVGVAATASDPALLLGRLGAEGVKIEQVARTGLAMVADELADLASRGGRLALLLTDDSPAALALANRRRGVRAALGADVVAVGRAVASIGCNLLVVEPAGRSLYALLQIVRAFCRGGPRACPDAYRNRLD